MRPDHGRRAGGAAWSPSGCGRAAGHAGRARSRVLLHVPHAGTHLPAWVRAHLLLDDAELAAEVAALTDHRTDALALAAAERAAVRPWVLVNPVSRFVVDVERFPDEREEMAAVGMGAVYTRGTRGQRIRRDDPAHAEALLDRVLPAVGRGRSRSWSTRAPRCCSTCTPTRATRCPTSGTPRGPARRSASAPTGRTRRPGWLAAAATAFAAFEVGPGQPVLRRLRARGRVRRPRSWWRSAATSTPPGRPSWWRRWRRWSTRST